MIIGGHWPNFLHFFRYNSNRCILQLKIHGTCPGEFEDVMKQLEESTGSVVVGQIGRTVILYRPSLSKLKAEEKKKQFQRDFLKRQAAFKQFPQVCSLFCLPIEISALHSSLFIVFRRVKYELHLFFYLYSILILII